MTLTYEQAVALYHQGLDPTVAMLLALVEENARLRADNEELHATLTAARAVPPSAPSGSIPPYAKPNTARGRRRRRPGRKPGHPGVTRTHRRGELPLPACGLPAVPPAASPTTLGNP